MSEIDLNQHHGRFRGGHRKTEHCTTCGKKLQGRIDKTFCDISCKNRYHAVARRLKNPELRAHAKLIARNVDILRGVMRRFGREVVIELAELLDMNYQINEVTSVDLTGDNKRLFVCGFELELLPGNYVRIVRRRWMVKRDLNREKESPEIDFGTFYRRWYGRYPEWRNHWDVRWLYGLLKSLKRPKNPPS